MRGASFTLDRGETLAIVGESGSGKSVTALSILQLLPYPAASHPTGSIRFAGEELIGRDERFLRTIRGARVGMIFQEPMTSLNPLHKVEQQIGEVLLVHRRLGRSRGPRRGRSSSCAWSASPSPRRGSPPIRTSSPAASASG